MWRSILLSGSNLIFRTYLCTAEGKAPGAAAQLTGPQRGGLLQAAIPVRICARLVVLGVTSILEQTAGTTLLKRILCIFEVADFLVESTHPRCHGSLFNFRVIVFLLALWHRPLLR